MATRQKNPVTKENRQRFVVASPQRSPSDPNARALYNHGLLRLLALGTRRGVKGVPAEFTRLNPKIGLVAYAFARTFSTYRAESLRFRLHPWFDHWVKKNLVPGDHLLSSYGHTNDSFRWVRAHGGKTFLDGGNSHPENFWTILAEEHRRWNCPDPPVAHHHNKRAVAMMEHLDYVLSPSNFVTRSFLDRGFKPEQILKNVYPVDLVCFSPDHLPRPKDRPLTIVSTGELSLRKGSPYLFEAVRQVVKVHPTARLRLTLPVRDSVKPILAKYADLPIDWSGRLPHDLLAARLRSSDIFVLPSLEEGLVRTALEALACGLPAILTPNTGASDFIVPGVNGEVVPIRDSKAIAEAILKWADLILSNAERPPVTFDAKALSFETFEKEFIAQLQSRGLA